MGRRAGEAFGPPRRAFPGVWWRESTTIGGSVDLAPPVADEQPPEVSGFRQRGDRALRVLAAALVAGLWVGIPVTGIGSRLAMRVILLTSGESVRGLRSDDGFIIGVFDLGDTLGLIAFAGVVVGVVGGGAYLIARPVVLRLPRWFRAPATGLVAAATSTPMLVHTDGVDFRFLGPLWVTVGSFALLAFLYGTLLQLAVEWLADGPFARWSLRRLALLSIPSLVPLPALIVYGPSLVGFAVREAAIDRGWYERWRDPVVLVMAIAGIALCLWGVQSLVADVVILRRYHAL